MSSKAKSLLLAVPFVVVAALGSAQTFPGTGVGAIPDGLAGTPPQYGPPLVVSFAVSGLTQNVTGVSLDVTLTHTWVGDIDMVLAAPGGAPALAPVSRIGVTTATGAGDSSNYGGTYLFSDGAMGANIWTVATTACDTSCILPSGTYRTTGAGGAGQTNPPPVTSFNATFAGLTPAQANGTWTLTLRDALQTDTGTVTAANLNIATTSGGASSQLVISEFRVRGPNGPTDEFVEILNNSTLGHTVAAASGSGYGLAASDGVVRCAIPNGTVMPPRGHFLCANSAGYSLAAYPAGNGASATGDATYASDIPDNAGIALFNNNTGGGSFSLANRLDAVGSTSEANSLYKEGSGYPALTPFSINYSFSRDECGKQGNINNFWGACPSGGFVLDSDNNAFDLIFNDTNGTSAGAGQRLGAPGPQNTSSPIHGGTRALGETSLDQCASLTAAPNFLRDFTSDPANNSTFGTIDIRRTFTNLTGAPITRLRFRVVDLTTFPAASGNADLRPRTSPDVTGVTVDRPPCGSGTSNVTVSGTTLEQPPSQPNGGGWNSSWSADLVSLATPLADGASIDVRFLLGIQQTGRFKLGVVVETLPTGTPAAFQINACTDTCPNFVKGDLNNDSLPDIVFRNVASGQQNKAWFMNAKTRVGEAAISPDAASADWLIRGVDDFDASSRNDLVFWNQTTGAVEFWIMSGTTRVGAPVPLSGAAILPTNWDLSATADFNHDGRPDIVWRNFTSQKIVIWTMNGTAKVGSIIPTPDQAVDANWAIVAAADYTGDGNTDFLWYNSTSGKIVTWYMNASVVRTSGQFTTPANAGDNNWKVVGSADFSASDMPGTLPAGSPDVLWRNATSGNQVIWHLNFGSTRVHGEFTDPAANTPALGWVVVGPR